MCFIRKNSLGRERAGNRKKRQGDISPSTHTVKSSKCLQCHSSQKRKLQSSLSKETNVKKRSPLGSAIASSCAGQGLAGVISVKGRIQTARNCSLLNRQQNNAAMKGEKLHFCWAEPFLPNMLLNEEH